MCTAKTQYREFETNIPRKEISWSQSRYPHYMYCNVSVNDLFIPTIALPILLQEKYVDQFWEYINRPQTHECGNWDWGRAIPFLGIYINGIFVAVCVTFKYLWDRNDSKAHGKFVFRKNMRGVPGHQGVRHVSKANDLTRAQAAPSARCDAFVVLTLR